MKFDARICHWYGVTYDVLFGVRHLGDVAGFSAYNAARNMTQLIWPDEDLDTTIAEHRHDV